MNRADVVVDDIDGIAHTSAPPASQHQPSVQIAETSPPLSDVDDDAWLEGPAFEQQARVQALAEEEASPDEG